MKRNKSDSNIINILIKLKKIIFEPGKSLSEKVYRGGIWVFLLQGTDQTIRLLRTIVLARLLAPDDFGLMGIALLVLSVLKRFSQTGFSEALIQKKEASDHLDTAWTISLFRGVILFCILFIFSPHISLFFENPKTNSIIRVISFSLLFDGLRNIAVIYFQKNLEFKKKFFFQISGTVIDLFVTIPLALILKTVWALAIGHIVRSFTQLLLSYRLSQYRPCFEFNLKKAEDLFSFGRWIFGSSILVFLITEGDDFLVAKILGATSLAFYQMAYKISNFPSTQLSLIVNQVTFPAFSKIQGDLKRIQKAFLNSFGVTSALSIGIAGGIFVLAEDITLVLLGNEWVDIIPVLQVLAIWGAIRALGGNTSPLLKALNKPNLITYFHLAMVFGLALIIYPLTVKWGILGTAIAVALSNFFIHWFRYPIISNAIGICSWKIYRLVLIPLMAAFIMVVVILFAKSSISFFANSNFYILMILIFIGLFIYSFVLYIFSKLFNYSGFDIIRKLGFAYLDQ